MDSLQNLLRPFQPPDEMAAIKRYVREQFSAPAGVRVRGNDIIVTVASGSLANTLQLRLPEVQRAANTDKRLIFRIGPVAGDA